ncbi:hypothetical protein F5880DRAFT_1502559 [Lentinula raphanica]|nr:hypothetical protein F5880DRAFT_1502559 [Lentinula raphanica]
MENTILLNVATTISYASDSTDPSNWLLRNVYANGTTQIGGVQSGTGTASFTFQSPGPHFLQAVAYNDTTSVVTSQPFYTGNLFTPVSSSSSSYPFAQISLEISSASSESGTSCPTSSSSYTSPDSNSSNVGALVGGIIGGLGFLCGVVFFILWFRLRKEFKRKPDFGRTIREANGYGPGNLGSGAALTPIIVPPFDGQPPTQAASSSISPTTTTDLSSPISRQHGTMKRRLPDVPMPGMAPNTPMDPALSPTQMTYPSSYSQHTRAESGDGVVRELSDLRREVQWLRQDIHGPPPSY